MIKTFEKILDNKYQVLIALIAPAFLLYFRSLHYDFTALDDQWLIVDNPGLKTGWAGFKKAWGEAISGTYYRPMLTGSFFLDYKMGKLSPFYYHLNNLLIHLICVILLYRFLSFNKVGRKLAFSLSVLFSLHPVALHAITWLPGRNDLLLCVFVLASLNNLLRFFNEGGNKFIVFHLFFFICALFTKENAVVLPFIFAVYLVVYKKETSNSFLYFILGWVGVSLVWFFIRNGIVSVQPELNLNGLFFKNLVPSFLIFIGKAVLPVQQSVLPTLKSSTLVPGVITLVGVLILIIRPGAKNKPLAWLGLLIFFLLLVIPVWFSATKSGSEYYEHRMYTSMAGLVLFISQLKFDWDSALLKAVGVFFFCFFCYKTYTRMPVYKNQDNFITAGSKESPDFYLFMFQKSGLLFGQQQYDSAMVYINKALAIRKDRPEMFTNRGSIYYMLGNYKESVADFETAIRLSRTFDYKMYLNRGFAYYKNGDLEKAKQDLDTLKKCCQAYIPQDFESEVSSKWKAQQDSLHH